MELILIISAIGLAFVLVTTAPRVFLFLLCTPIVVWLGVFLYVLVMTTKF